jgi:hypothetical protein
MRNRKIVVLGLACGMAAFSAALVGSALVDGSHSAAAAQGRGEGGPGGGGGGPGGLGGAGGGSGGLGASGGAGAGVSDNGRGSTASIAGAGNADARAPQALEHGAFGLAVADRASDPGTTGTEKAAAINELLEQQTCGSC